MGLGGVVPLEVPGSQSGTARALGGAVRESREDKRMKWISSMFGLAFLASPAFGASLSYLRVTDRPSAISQSKCVQLTAEQVNTHPPSGVRKRICFQGVLYVDREFIAVFPAEVGQEAEPFSVTVSLPPTKDRSAELAKLDGGRVWLIADLIYNSECWSDKSTKNDDTKVCTPAKKPIASRHVTLVVEQWKPS